MRHVQGAGDKADKHKRSHVPGLGDCLAAGSPSCICHRQCGLARLPLQAHGLWLHTSACALQQSRLFVCLPDTHLHFTPFRALAKPKAYFCRTWMQHRRPGCLSKCRADHYAHADSCSWHPWCLGRLCGSNQRLARWPRKATQATGSSRLHAESGSRSVSRPARQRGNMA